MSEPSTVELRLAEAAYTEASLRELVEILLHEGDAVFASRSWRVGATLSGAAGRVLAWFGKPLPPAQSAAHLRAIAAAHLDELARRRLLLEQMVTAPSSPEDAEDALREFWRTIGTEQVIADPP
jgi:hypothetical protein